MVTKNGVIKKTKISDFEQVRRSGLRAIKLEDGDQLVFAKVIEEGSEILLASSAGNIIRFKEEELRPMGRNATGVRGMRLNLKSQTSNLKTDDKIVGMEIIKNQNYLLTLSENGFGKRTDIQKFRLQKRGGKGIMGMKITEKTGSLARIGLLTKDEEEDLIVISKKVKQLKQRLNRCLFWGVYLKE